MGAEVFAQTNSKTVKDVGDFDEDRGVLTINTTKET